MAPGKSKVIRSTFVFDEQGELLRVYPNVKVDGHAEKVLADLG
jgi:peroxiredoxin